MSFIDALVLGCGVYILYHTYIMKRDGIIPQGVMVNKGVLIPKDADVAGFILTMYWKGIALGVTACISGALGLACVKYPQLQLMTTIFSCVFFAALIVFVVYLKKAHKKFLHLS